MWYVLNIVQLLERLHDLGIDVPQRTLRYWAYHGLVSPSIPVPQRTRRKLGRRAKYEEPAEREITKGRPGRYHDWSEDAVSEAAAAWATLNLIDHRKQMRLVRIKKRYAQKLLPILRTPTFSKKCGDYFRGNFRPDLSKERYSISSADGSMVAAWVTAFEKARACMSIPDPYEVTFDVAIKTSGQANSPYFFRGVQFELFDAHVLTWHRYYLDTPHGRDYDRTHYSECSR
jgi:hypothetical protein